MLMPRPLRRLVLTVHLTASVGWIGALLAYLALTFTARSSQDARDVRAAFVAMELTGDYALVPLAVTALGTGIVLSLATPWGLVRHYWTVIALVLTTVCTVVLILNMRTVSARADLARESDEASLGRVEADLLHPGVGLALLMAVMVLNVYKPQGLTRYGWRRQQAGRQQAALRGAPAAR